MHSISNKYERSYQDPSLSPGTRIIPYDQNAILNKSGFPGNKKSKSVWLGKYRKMLLQHQFEKSVKNHPDKIALITGGNRYSYRKINDVAIRLGAYLQERDVRRGDRVVLFLDNSFEAVVSIFAILKIGAVFLPVHPQTKKEKLAYILNNSQAVFLMTQKNLLKVAAGALDVSPSLQACVVVGSEADTPGGKKYCGFNEAVTSSSVKISEPGTIDQDLASIVYTSGSTGNPKGVMLSHLNMVTAANSVSSYLGLNADDIILCALPLSFDYGLYQILMAFKLGATVVLERSFTFPVKVIEAMEKEKVTVFPGVPTMFSLLMNMELLAEYQLDHLRIITNTAAALTEEHIRGIRKSFSSSAIYSMYGLTECKRVTYMPPDELHERPTSVGKGMPNQEIYLIDESGKRLPDGSVGELVVRGSHVMKGYWENEAETKEKLKPGPVPGEMILHTGDIFRTDDDGYLYFVGRKDDIIKSRGEKVSPKEVENVLYAMDGVLEVVVIGVSDNVLGQAVKSFLVLKEGYEYTERDVIKYCISHLENYMVPKHVEFRQELPKTRTGKIKKTGLR